MDKLKQKIGPLPMYVWIGMVVIAGVGYMLWKRHTASSADATGTSTTAASTLPATATTGYVMSDTGGQGWSGYNNNGSPAVTSPAAPANTYVLLPTVGAVKAAVAAGMQLFEQPTPGVFTPYSGGVPGSNLPSTTLLSTTQATPLFTIGNGTASPTPSGVPAAVGAAATAPVSAINTPVGTAGNPSSAIAPSALQGTPIGPAPTANPAQQAMAASTPGNPAPVSVGNVTTGAAPAVGIAPTLKAASGPLV